MKFKTKKRKKKKNLSKKENNNGLYDRSSFEPKQKEKKTMDNILYQNGPDVFLIIGILMWILILVGIIMVVLGATLPGSPMWPYWVAASVLGFISIVGAAVLGFGFFWKKRISASIEGAIEDKKACKTVARYCEINILPVACPKNIFLTQEMNPKLAEFCGRNVYHLEVIAKRFVKVHGKESTTMISEFPFPRGTQLVGLITKRLHNNDTPISGLVCVCRATNTCFVFFRGTITMNEWKQDLNFKTTSVSRLFETGIQCDQNIKVHSGFMNIFLAVCESFDDAMNVVINGYGITNIVISGHSLGAALASQFSFYLASHSQWQNHSLQIQTYCFGKPRVGNIEYSQCFNSKQNLALFRFENVNDPVPQLPLSCTPNLVFPSEPFIFQHEGKVFAFDTNLASLGLNHFMPIYLDHIKTLILE